MGRIRCCEKEKEKVKRGEWTPEEDNKLSSYIAQHGTRNWRLIPNYAGLQRCGKSCRLRWTNYLRPDLKHGQFTDAEEQTIVKLHSVVGNRWSLIAAQLPGRTDNDVKNQWNTKLKKKLSGMGIDPVTHKPFSHLMAEIATTLALATPHPPPQVADHLAEAALGCFKDEMLHLLTNNRIVDTFFHFQQQSAATYIPSKHEEDKDIHNIKLIGFPRPIKEPELLPSNKPWDSTWAAFPESVSGFQYGPSSCFGNNEEDGSPWSQSMCTAGSGSGSAGDQQGRLCERLEDENREDQSQSGKELTRNGPTMFNPECFLWDIHIPSDDLMNLIV